MLPGGGPSPSSRRCSGAPPSADSYPGREGTNNVCYDYCCLLVWLIHYIISIMIIIIISIVVVFVCVLFVLFVIIFVCLSFLPRGNCINSCLFS